MTGKNQPSKWQDKHLRKLENLVHDPAFQKDTKQLGIPADFGPLYTLATKYDVQPLLILEYIKNQKVSPDHVVPSISIICDEDETAGPAKNLEEAQFKYIAVRGFPHKGIYLHIPPGSSQIEIASFIRDNWSYMEAKIGKPVRNKRHQVSERNAYIMELHEQGLDKHEILERVKDHYSGNLIIDDIGAIIRKNK